MGFDSFRGEVPDGPDGQVAFESAEDGFDFGKLDVLAPEFGWIAALEVGAQEIGPVATGAEPQGVPIPSPARAEELGS